MAPPGSSLKVYIWGERLTLAFSTLLSTWMGFCLEMALLQQRAHVATAQLVAHNTLLLARTTYPAFSHHTQSLSRHTQACSQNLCADSSSSGMCSWEEAGEMRFHAGLRRCSWTQKTLGFCGVSRWNSRTRGHDCVLQLMCLLFMELLRKQCLDCHGLSILCPLTLQILG